MGRTLPAPDSTAGRTVSPRLQGRPGGSALGRCQPRCRPDGPTRAPPPATPFPIPSPASGTLGPRVSSPACAGVAAVPAAAPGSFPRRPGLFPARAAPRGERRTARVAEAGALGAPALPTWEAAPTPGAGTQGKARTGRPAEGRAPLISHASHVWGHPAAFFFLSPFAFSPLPCWRGQSGRGGAMPGPE